MGTDNAKVSGSTWVSGNAQVTNNAQVFGSARVSDNARVYGNAQVSGSAWVYGSARVHGVARVCAGSVGPDADVFLPDHVVAIVGMFPDPVTVYRTQDGSPRIQAGCQNFGMDTDMWELALTHEWPLPDGWESQLEVIAMFSQRWRNDRPTD